MATKRRRHRKSRKGRMPAGLARYWATHRRGKTARRRKKSIGYARKTFKAMAGYDANPPKRRRRRHTAKSVRRHRRSYRINPGIGSFIPSMGFLKEVAFVGGGFYANKIVSGYITPMIPFQGNIPRLAVKAALAVGLAWLGGMALGPRAKESLLIGGGLSVFTDAVSTYVSPFVPALAGSDMQAYYLPTVSGDMQGTDQATGAYYQVGELPSDNYAG